VRITKVYTKQGDGGETRLGGGQKVAKDATRISAYGTVDELNSVIGVVLTTPVSETTRNMLTRIQHELFVLGGELCVLEEDKAKWDTMPTIEDRHVTALEQSMDKLNENLEPLEEFILPGGTDSAAFLHQARCICRRAERLVVALGRDEAVKPVLLRYLNRLSDTLFVLARYENHQRGLTDVYWQKP